jgi:formiminotetrahydrofolate cyclodeaminase
MAGPSACSEETAVAYVDQSLGEFLELVGQPRHTPGGAAVAAVTASLAAGLVAMAGPEHADDLTALGKRAAALADEDAAAYAEVAQAGSGASAMDALTRATEVPLEIAATAAEITRLAAQVFLTGRPGVRGDVATALLLAEGATRSAAYLVEVNVDDGGGTRDLVGLARRHIATARTARELAGGRVPIPADH